jgi:predicted lactoylglutathione lyase
VLPAPLIVALPIADRSRSHRFYTEGLGLTSVGELAEDGLPEPLQVVVNDGVRLMLIPTGGFGWTIAGRQVAEAGTVECQLTVGFGTEDEVDSFIGRAREAGAEMVSEPRRQPWGYAGNFADLDGHLWMALATPVP